MPQNNTTKLSLTLTVDLIKAIKKRSKQLFGTRKGAISNYVEMTLRKDLQLQQKDVDVE
jgi:hypothetical protein